LYIASVLTALGHALTLVFLTDRKRRNPPVKVLMYGTALLGLGLTSYAMSQTPTFSHGTAQKSPAVQEKVLIDNDDVKVTRVVIPKGATQIPDQPRCKRVIVWVTPTHTERHAKMTTSTANMPEDKGEVMTRPAGEALFRTASKHSITNLGNQTQISVIVELKHDCGTAKN
jgi:hypothetical protein